MLRNKTRIRCWIDHTSPDDKTNISFYFFFLKLTHLVSYLQESCRAPFLPSTIEPPFGSGWRTRAEYERGTRSGRPSRIWTEIPTEFEAELLYCRIELINSRQCYPQTNGKSERFHRSVEEEMEHWDTLSEYVTYYNERRLRISLDINNHQTSLKVFSDKRSLETIRQSQPYRGKCKQ